MSARIIESIQVLRTSIVARLSLLILLIFLAAAGVVLVNLVLSRQIGETLHTVIHQDVTQVIDNAELSRNLNSIFAETHLLLNIFTDQQDFFHTESRRLLALVQNNLAARQGDPMYATLVRFQDALQALLTECAVVLEAFAQIQMLERDLEIEIVALDDLATELILSRKIAGKDYELLALEQVSAAIPDYRNWVGQVAMQIANIRRDYLGDTFLEETYEKPISAIFAELSSNLLIVATAGDEFAQAGQHLIATVQRYQAAITTLHAALRTFQAQLQEMHTAQAQVMAIMQTLDGEVANATGRIGRNVTRQIQASRRMTLAFSIIILLVLIGIGGYAARITRPILHLTTSAAAIADGNLDTPIDHRGTDEVGQLARSFAHMRDAIRAEMDALEEKNTALQQEIIERERAEEALRTLNDELEFRVRQRTAKMEAANKDLKDFAYIVSHDLKAPLRGITRLSQWLKEDYAGKLDHPGQEQLDLLVAQVKRMDRLIDGVLRYSRAVHGSDRTELIDLNPLIAQVIEMLMPPAQIAIRVETTLPVIYGDPTQVVQVFQNLLSNAVKFMDKPDGQITVIAEDDDTHWTFQVEDNGPGIDARHHDRIFQIFQTEGPQNHVESTGIGLTVVKKIIELYGGRVWVESTVGQGSRLVFSWPKSTVDYV